jgi:hypothetical protein
MSSRDCKERERVGFSVPVLCTSCSCAVVCVCVSVSVRLLGKLRRRWGDNVKMDLKKELRCAPAAVRVGISDVLLWSR